MARTPSKKSGALDAGAFDRDFGYLAPFLDRVVQAAPALADPTAREELQRMMVDEKARWARIRALLSGAPGQLEGGRGPRPVVSVQPHQPVPRPGAALGLTVGQLKPRR